MKVNILGVNVTRMNMPQAIQSVRNAIQSRHKLFIVVPNVFVVVECNKDKDYKQIINSADMALPDGMPLVWASYLLGQYTGGRVSGPDFFSIFNEVAEKEGYTCFYLGGGPGGSERVVENLKRRHPALKIVGNFSPPLGEISNELNDLIVEMINTAEPDILWVGLGSPRQERWIAGNLHRLNVRIVIGVGAAFDYEAGKKQRGPRWVRKIGAEWAYRIWQDPVRLWQKKCYAYPWEFVLPVLRQIIKERTPVFKKGK